MYAWEFIPAEVVNWYEDSIYFMVDTDTCLMEAIIPRTTWVMPMGYEVDKYLLVSYANHSLAQPVDTTAERFGTYKKKTTESTLWFTETIDCKESK